MKTLSALPGGDKPRVLVVVRWPVGGIRTWCRYVYRDPTFSGYDIEILMPKNDEEASYLRDDLADTSIKVTLVDSGDSLCSFGFAVAKRVLLGNYSLVHSHGFTSGLLAACPSRLKRTPHLLTQHDVILAGQYRDLKGQVARSLIALLLRTATCIQPVGQAAAGNLASAFPGSLAANGNMRVVRNGIDSAHFLYAAPEEVRIRYGIPMNAIVVGFFGRFMAQKGFRYLVEAVIHYKATNSGGPPMVVLAVGGGGFRREEEQAIKMHGIEDYFRFVDFTPNVAGLLKAVDVVAMPSLWEACPLLPMEALISGAPLVVSDWSACLEVVKDTPARVVAMRDSIGLLNGILEMAKPESRIAAQQFSAIAASRFDVSLTIEGIASIYESLRKGKVHS